MRQMSFEISFDSELMSRFVRMSLPQQSLLNVQPTEQKMLEMLVKVLIS